jgi:hypothetical protein
VLPGTLVEHNGMANGIVQNAYQLGVSELQLSVQAIFQGLNSIAMTPAIGEDHTFVKVVIRQLLSQRRIVFSQPLSRLSQ